MKLSAQDRYEKVDFFMPDFKIKLMPERDSALTYREPMFHEEIEIKLFYEGNTTLMIDSDILTAVPGDITIVNPYELHNTVQVEGQAGKYHLINMSLDFLMEQNPKGLDLRFLLLTKGICFRNQIRADGELQRLLLRVIEEMQQQPESYKLMVQSLLTEFFLILLRREQDTEKTGRIPSKDLRYFQQIEPALRMIRRQYAQRITLEELADACGMSKYHFCRVFSQCTNLTVMQCLTEYRLKVANHLLLHTNKTLAEIVQDCGFAEQGYFSRCYKKFYGIPPAQHRKMSQEK